MGNFFLPVGAGLHTIADIMGCSIGDVVMVFFPDAVLLLPNLVYGVGGA